MKDLKEVAGNMLNKLEIKVMINWIKAKERLPLDNQRILFSPQKYETKIAVYVEKYNDGKSFGSHYFVCEDGSRYNWHQHPKSDFQWAEIIEPVR